MGSYRSPRSAASSSTTVSTWPSRRRALRSMARTPRRARNRPRLVANPSRPAPGALGMDENATASPRRGPAKGATRAPTAAPVAMDRSANRSMLSLGVGPGRSTTMGSAATSWGPCTRCGSIAAHASPSAAASRHRAMRWARSRTSPPPRVATPWVSALSTGRAASVGSPRVTARASRRSRGWFWMADRAALTSVGSLSHGTSRRAVATLRPRTSAATTARDWASRGPPEGWRGSGAHSSNSSVGATGPRVSARSIRATSSSSRGGGFVTATTTRSEGAFTRAHSTPGMLFEGLFHPARHLFPADAVHTVHLDVVAARVRPHPAAWTGGPAGRPRRRRPAPVRPLHG